LLVSGRSDRSIRCRQGVGDRSYVHLMQADRGAVAIGAAGGLMDRPRRLR
jgi:hypothetical protein